MDADEEPLIAVARIPDGTAFAVCRNFALTAAHNVTPGARIDLEFPRRGPAAARVVDADDGLDLAVLAIDEFPGMLVPLPLTDELPPGRTFRSCGYPLLPEFDRSLDRWAILGTIIDEGAELDGVPALQLEVQAAGTATPLVLKGMSGAPVLVGDPPHAAGVIRWQPSAGGPPVGNACYATPAWAALRRWPDLLRDAFERPQRARWLRPPLAPGGDLPLFGSVGPDELGLVTGPHGAKEGTAPYVPRQGVDDALSAALDAAVAASGGQPDRLPALLVTGPPRAGKSRSGYELLSRRVPGHSLAVPRDCECLGELLAADARKPLTLGPVVVWLDELQRYLPAPGIRGDVSLDRIRAFCRREHGALLVATMRTDQYLTYASTESALDPRATEIVTEFAGSGQRVEVPRLATAAELAEAQRLYPGEKFKAGVGIGEMLGRSAEIVRRYRAEPSAHRLAVVRAAVDWERVGMRRTLTPDELRTWYERYLHDLWPGESATEATFTEALRWACEPVYPHGRAALLERIEHDTDYGVRADDYLLAVDDGATQEPSRPVASFAWHLAIPASAHAPEQAFGMALSAVERKDWAAAIAASESVSDPARIGTPSCYAYGFYLDRDQDYAELMRQVRSRREAGGLDGLAAAYQLAMLTPSWPEARDALIAATAAPDGDFVAGAWFMLGTAYAARSMHAEAAAAWQSAVEHGSGFEVIRAADKLTALLDHKREALAVWERAAQVTPPGIAQGRIALLNGRKHEARRHLESAARSRDVGIALEALRVTVQSGLAPAAAAEALAKWLLAEGIYAHARMHVSHGSSPPVIESWYRLAINATRHALRMNRASTRCVPAGRLRELEGMTIVNLGNHYSRTGSRWMARWAWAHAAERAPAQIAQRARESLGQLGPYDAGVISPYATYVFPGPVRCFLCPPGTRPHDGVFTARTAAAIRAGGVVGPL